MTLIKHWHFGITPFQNHLKIEYEIFSKCQRLAKDMDVAEKLTN